MNFLQLINMNKKEQIFQELVREIEWDNWMEEDGTFMDITGVYYSKLNSFKENLPEDIDEEHLDFIDSLERFLTLFNEKSIKKMIRE